MSKLSKNTIIRSYIGNHANVHLVGLHSHMYTHIQNARPVAISYLPLILLHPPSTPQT